MTCEVTTTTLEKEKERRDNGEGIRKTLWEEGHEDTHVGARRCREDQYPSINNWRLQRITRNYWGLQKFTRNYWGICGLCSLWWWLHGFTGVPGVCVCVCVIVVG